MGHRKCTPTTSGLVCAPSALSSACSCVRKLMLGHGKSESAPPGDANRRAQRDSHTQPRLSFALYLFELCVFRRSPLTSLSLIPSVCFCLQFYGVSSGELDRERCERRRQRKVKSQVVCDTRFVCKGWETSNRWISYQHCCFQ